jgi:hypothetical protein
VFGQIGAEGEIKPRAGRIELPDRAEPSCDKQVEAAVFDRSLAQLRPASWEFHHLAIDSDHVLSAWTICVDICATGGGIS